MEIEEIPIHFYEDGIELLQTALILRTTEAVYHWQGKTDFNKLDLISKIAETMLSDKEDEAE